MAIAIQLSNTLLRRSVRAAKVGAWDWDLYTDIVILTADRVQVQQVLMNLVMNSLDALSEVTDGQRILSIRADLETAKSVRVVVEDTGMGIEPHRMKEIFEPFHTTKAHGLGLGLSISRSIIEAHGGRLRAIRNDGPGVTFHFTFPLEPYSAA